MFFKTFAAMVLMSNKKPFTSLAKLAAHSLRKERRFASFATFWTQLIFFLCLYFCLIIFILFVFYIWVKLIVMCQAIVGRTNIFLAGTQCKGCQQAK